MTQIKTIIAIFPGRFQPFHKDHFTKYKWAVQQFGAKNTFIGTSNVVTPPNSPLSFKEKKAIINHYGIKNVVQIKDPYKAVEIVSKFDPKTTAAVFILGAKDAARLGGPFFRKWTGKADVGYRDGAYILLAPQLASDELSGTMVRKALSSKLSPEKKKQEFKKIFGWYDQSIFNLLVKKFEITESTIKESTGADGLTGQTVDANWLAPGKELHIRRGKGMDGWKQVEFPTADNPFDKDSTEIRIRTDTITNAPDMLDKLYAELQKAVPLGALSEAITIPIEIGDEILTGKFKNKKIIVKTIGKNEKGDLTINGSPILRVRITKKEVEEMIDEIVNGPSEIKEGLVDHAESEVKRAGLLDKDADYGGMIGKAVLELMDTFSKQGHSGFSAQWVRELFNKLSNYETLTPLTNESDEWNDVSEMLDKPFWQNKRNPAVFSIDGGKTMYHVDGKTIKNGIVEGIRLFQSKKKLFEGKDYVVCEICKKKLKRIHSFHLNTHNLSISEYLNKFPCALLLCENTRKLYSENNSMNDKQSIEKIKATKLEKYGDENYCNPNKIKETCQLKYNSETYLSSDDARQKIKETNLKKFGAETPSKNIDVRKKISDRVKELYELGLKERKTWKNPEKEYATKVERGLITPIHLKSMRDQYYQKVKDITQESYTEYFYEIPNAKTRSREFHLDHKISKHYGFTNNIPPEVIGHYCNLEILPHSVNESKATTNSITLPQLLVDIKNSKSPLNLISEGGGFGHVSHPFEEWDLTFNDLKTLIEGGLSGELSKHTTVLEKCIEGDSIVTLESAGETKISDVVDKNIDDNILAFNEETQKNEFLPIQNKFNNGIHDEWLKIELEDGRTICATPNHKFYIEGIGYIRADQLSVNDDLKII